MARITITIEDRHGKVRVTARPRLEDLMAKADGRPGNLTQAEVYAIAALTGILKLSRKSRAQPAPTSQTTPADTPQRTLFAAP